MEQEITNSINTKNYIFLGFNSNGNWRNTSIRARVSGGEEWEKAGFHDVRDRLYSRAVIRNDAWNVRNVNERRDRRYVTCHFHSRSDQAENFILCSNCSRPIRRDDVYWIDTRSLFFSTLIKSISRYYPLDGGLRGLHLLIV